MRELALFAGAGGGILGGVLLGWRTVCAVEIDPYCRRVLMQRQNDGVLHPFPIWDDVRTFDGTPWRGLVDVISAGFPCQPFSVAGKRLADSDERNLWPETARILGEVRPRFAFLENVPGLLAHPYFGAVLGDLSALGYDVRWGVVGALHAGAPHERRRLWVMADAERDGRPAEWSIATIRDRQRNCTSQELGRFVKQPRTETHSCPPGNERWPSCPRGGPERRMGRITARPAHFVDRLKALGNGQVPLVAATAWEILSHD